MAQHVGSKLGLPISLKQIDPVINETMEKKQRKSKSFYQKMPVIVLLGHYNHGKTSLLDAFLQSKVQITSKEPFGITQEIRARSFQIAAGRSVTVLDTPGQEVFHRLRTEGSLAADLGVLVVDIQSGVELQTSESIGAAEEANLPLLIALNKVDLCTTDFEAKKQQAEDGLREFCILENAPLFPVSAVTQAGLSELKAGILAALEEKEMACQSEFSVPDGEGYGTVLDYSVSHTKGQQYMLLVRCGTVTAGDWFVCGLHWGSIRSLHETTEKPVQEAKGGMVVIVRINEKSGAKISPITEPFYILPQQKAEEVSKVRQLAQQFENAKRTEIIEVQSDEDSESPTDDCSEENVQDDNELGTMYGNNASSCLVPIALKVDTGNSLSTIMDAIDEHHKNVQVVIASIGNLCKQDVLVAEAAGCPIFIFNAKVDRLSQDLARKSNVKLINEGTIPELLKKIEELSKAQKGKK